MKLSQLIIGAVDEGLGIRWRFYLR